MSEPFLPAAPWPTQITQAATPANENALRLQILASLVISKATTAQPGTPADGDVYIIPAGATGTDWATFAEDDVAIYREISGVGAWYAFTPHEGLVLNVAGTLEVFDSVTGWGAIAGGSSADAISYDNTTSGLAAADVQAAIDELAAAVPGGSGVSVGIQYTADTDSTADSDPGAGLLKWNNATQPSATFLYLDDATADAAGMTGLWAALDAGGFTYLQHGTDQDIWQIFEITGVTDAAGYVKLAVTYLAGNGTFVDGAPMLVTIEQGAASGSGLVYFAEARNTSAPNATVPVHSLTASGAESNIDFALVPKGTGAIVAQVPNNLFGGGNKRGTRAVDLQLSRNSASSVASGLQSFAAGYDNTASGNYSVAIGEAQTASGANSVALGRTGTASGADSVKIGAGGAASGARSISLQGATANADDSYGLGPTGNTRSIQRVTSEGQFGTADYQRHRMTLARTTTDATSTVLTTNGSAPGASNVWTFTHLSNNALVVRGMVVARANGNGGAVKAWEFHALVNRDNNTGAIIGTPTINVIAESASLAWAVSLAISSSTLQVTVVGAAATTIRWACHLDIQEVPGS